MTSPVTSAVVRALFAAVVLLCASAGTASAHSASTSYIVAAAAGRDVAIQWSLALRDLDDAIGLDRNGDGQLTWGEVRTQAARIDAYALARLHISAGGAACAPLAPPTHLADDLADGGYVVLRFALRCPAAIQRLHVAYSALFEVDPQHRGLLSASLDGASSAAVFAPQARETTVEGTPSLAKVARRFFADGVGHILGGPDHLLFIVVLLAPALLRPMATDAAQGPLRSTASRLVGVTGVLTAFTLGHGVALSVAVLGVVSVPPAIVEPAIALTILLTAIDNLRAFLPGRRWMLGLGFGLVHGFGVASGLGPLLLPPLTLAMALLAFNLGLEAVQLAIALALAPAGLAARALPAVARGLTPGLSVAAAIVAILWVGQRIETPLPVQLQLGWSRPTPAPE